MSWFRRFIAVVTCRSCKTADERAFQKRNKLGQKLGKNKVVPLAPTDLDIRIEREEIISACPSSAGVDDNGDLLTQEGKWAAPRTTVKGSVNRDLVDDSGDQLTPESNWAAPRTPGIGNVSRNSVDDPENLLTQEGKWAVPRTQSNGSISIDSSLAEFALNYVNTEVLPGAISRFLAKQNGNNDNVYATISGCSINISGTKVVRRNTENHTSQ